MRYLSNINIFSRSHDKLTIKDGKVTKAEKNNFNDNTGEKVKYAIVTYCSETYLDAYNFVIPSWIQNSSADRIFIYTDSPNFNRICDKVKIIPLFQKDESWIIGTGRRLEAIREFTFNNIDYKYFAFMDVDCYITRDFSNIFMPLKRDLFDFAITRLFSNPDSIRKDGTMKPNATATAGLFFAKNNNNFKTFVEEWTRLAQVIKKTSDIANREHKVSYVQYSFTELAWAAFHEQKPYRIHVASERIYNSERSDIEEWKNDILKYRPKILHFKGNRYRDKLLCQKIFELYKEKNPYGVKK